MKAESTSPAPPESRPVSNGAAATSSGRKMPVIRVAERRQPVVLPLIPSARPGSADFTAEQIAEVLEKQDAPS